MFLTILLLKIQVLWDVTLHCWASGLQCVALYLRVISPWWWFFVGWLLLKRKTVVSEWFPVSILNDCVCVRLPSSWFKEESSLWGDYPWSWETHIILWNVRSQWPKDTASPPRRHESSAMVFKLACLNKHNERQQMLLLFGRLLDFIVSYYSSKSFWGKILNISFRFF